MQGEGSRVRSFAGSEESSADAILSLGEPPPARLQDAHRAAADEVDRLVDELEPTLDAWQRRLLHQIRLAAESLGAVGAASLLRGQR